MATSTVHAQCYSHEEQIKNQTGDIVEIYVGPKRKMFKAHRNLLASACPHLKAKFKPSCKGNLCPSAVYFRHYDPEAFALFIDWLYRRALPQLNPYWENLAKEQVGRYIALYLMADKWGILDLKNLIIDTFQARETCAWGWFPAKLIKKIFTATQKESPLRRYIVDTFLFKPSRDFWNEAGRAIQLKAHMEIGSFDFVMECYEGLYSMAYKSKMKARDPTCYEKCVYHEHAQGKECPLWGED